LSSTRDGRRLIPVSNLGRIGGVSLVPWPRSLRRPEGCAPGHARKRRRCSQMALQVAWRSST
jgi:hypothetical protein